MSRFFCGCNKSEGKEAQEYDFEPRGVNQLEKPNERPIKEAVSANGIYSLQNYEWPDEKELDRIQAASTRDVDHQIAEICARTSRQYVESLLSKPVKVEEDYRNLAVQDSRLQFGELALGSLKYVGQIRNTKKSDQGKQGDNDDQVGEASRCGFGQISWPDGSEFEGYWITNMPIGIGSFRTPSLRDQVFIGQWELDKSTGLCVFRKTNGADGSGIEVWSDGSYYFGHFYEGIKQGQGVYFWTDGSRYEGEWHQDEMSGTGHFKWADGRSFHGNFAQGVMHGHGIYTWQDGRRYEGSYNHNKKHGEGTYTYSDGSRYQGQWVDGLQHGVGCIIEPGEGAEKKGLWEKGKLKQWFPQQK